MNETHFTAKDLEYFGQNVGVVLGLYGGTLLLVVLGLIFCSNRDYGRNPSRGYKILRRSSEGDDEMINSRCAINNSGELIIEYFSGTIFESTYVSYRGMCWSYSLLATRVLSFCFFFSIPLLVVFIHEKGRNWIYFTFWNIELIVLYFLLASIVSMIGFFKKPTVCVELSDENYQSYNWTRVEMFLGVSVQILYVVAAPSALFITLSTYVYRSARLELDGASFHLANLIAFVIELILNSVIVRLEHVMFFVSWLLLYVIYVWGMVLSGALSNWPYSEFQTTTQYSYWGLYISSIICYFVWYMLSKLKFLARGEYASSLISLSTEEFAPMLCSE